MYQKIRDMVRGNDKQSRYCTRNDQTQFDRCIELSVWQQQSSKWRQWNSRNRSSSCIRKHSCKYSARILILHTRKTEVKLPLHAMEALGGRGVRLLLILDLGTRWGEWSASRPGRAFTPGERTPGTHCTGDWMGPRTGLDTEARGKILCPCRGSNPGSKNVVCFYIDIYIL
jgi:hypothetical protein